MHNILAQSTPGVMMWRNNHNLHQDYISLQREGTINSTGVGWVKARGEMRKI
jgi:hypothetical protein